MGDPIRLRDDDLLEMRVAVVSSNGEATESLKAAGFRSVSQVDDPSSDALRDADLVIVHLAATETVDLLHLLAERFDGPAALAVAADAETRRRALAAGARDVVADPGDAGVLGARARTLLEATALRRLLTDAGALLEERVRERTRELEEARLEILDRLVRAAEYRDDDTRDHTRRVGEASALLAAHAGLGREEVLQIRLAAPLHDVGKIGVSDAILLKAGPLSEEEFDEIRTHPVIGGRILWGTRAPVLKIAQEIALFHHERWDGSGYPAGLQADEIPLPARIVCVADVFDALTHDRPYKKRWPVDRALAEISAMGGTHLDPALAAAFVEVARAGALDAVEWT